MAKQIARYPNIVQWWVCCAKRRIKSMFIKESAERNSDKIKMEKFYYTALYGVLQEPGQHAAKAIKLKNLKQTLFIKTTPTARD